MAKKKDSVDHDGQRYTNGDSAEPDFSDPEDFEDDITEEGKKKFFEI